MFTLPNLLLEIVTVVPDLIDPHRPVTQDSCMLILQPQTQHASVGGWLGIRSGRISWHVTIRMLYVCSVCQHKEEKQGGFRLHAYIAALNDGVLRVNLIKKY
jgi:hypothetical protein